MHKEYLCGQILRILFSSVSVIFGRGFSIHAAPVGTHTFGKAKFQFFFLRNSHLLQKHMCHPLLHSHSWAILCPVFLSLYVFRVCEITSVCDVGHFSSCDLWLLF